MTPIRSRFRKFFAFILLISIIPPILCPDGIVSDSFYIAILPVIAAFVFLLGSHSEPLFSRSKSVWFFAILLTALFTAMLSITDLINSCLFSAEQMAEYLSSEELCAFLAGWSRTVFLPAFFISQIFVFQKSLSLILNRHSRSDDDTAACIRWCTVAFCLCTFICLFSTWPGGYMQDDVNAVWTHVTSNRLNDWHTVGFELFCSLCASIYQSPFTVNVVQSILWILLNHKILKTFDAMALPKSALIFYTVLNVSVFTPFLYLQVMMKDIMFGISLTAFTLCILIIVNGAPSFGDYVLCILSGLGVILFRHAQMLPVMLTFAVCFLYLLLSLRKCQKTPSGIAGDHRCRQKKKAVLRLFLSICAVLLLYTAIEPVYCFDHLKAEKNPEYVTYSTPLAMVGNALSRGIEFSEKDTKILEQLMPLDEYVDCYSKYYIDDISRSWGEIGVDRCYRFEQLVDNDDFGSELIRINADLAVHYPVEYISGLLDASSIIWEIARPSDSKAEWGLHSLDETPDRIQYSALYPVTRGINDFLSDTPILRSFCNRGGIWLFALIYSAVLLILKRRGRDLTAMLPVFIISLMLLLTTPAQHTRYIIPTMECAFLFLAYSFCVKKQKTSVRTSARPQEC